MSDLGNCSIGFDSMCKMSLARQFSYVTQFQLILICDGHEPVSNDNDIERIPMVKDVFAWKLRRNLNTMAPLSALQSRTTKHEVERWIDNLLTILMFAIVFLSLSLSYQSVLCYPESLCLG
jgi:hypothetical protein